MNAKNVIWGIVLIVVASYFTNNYFENKEKEEKKEAKKSALREEVSSKISAMIKNNNAISGWEDELSKGESVRISPILTVELQKAWIRDRPIYFSGVIKDIEATEGDLYRLNIEKGLLNNSGHMFLTGLQLSLICKKEIIKPILDNFSDVSNNFISIDNVAVIADIRKIESKELLGPEGEKKVVRIGIGVCNELLYIGSKY